MAVLAVVGVLLRQALSARLVVAMVNLLSAEATIPRQAGRAFPQQAATATVADFVRVAVVVVVDKLPLALLRKTVVTVARRLRSLILHRIPAVAALRRARRAGQGPMAALRQTAASAAMVAAVDRPQQPVQRGMAATAALLAVAVVAVGAGLETPLALAARAVTALSE